MWFAFDGDIPAIGLAFLTKFLGLKHFMLKFPNSLQLKHRSLYLSFPRLTLLFLLKLDFKCGAPYVLRDFHNTVGVSCETETGLLDTLCS